ncbi:hypothetical protein [Streptomyces lavendulae]|uniref:hypothetical protein n=1 Tax=Streptomyces lavendulae TaxID=1914 RepID=UPI001F4718F3|nr:hypothetical protein [Streptomyces lavendulae]
MAVGPLRPAYVRVTGAATGAAERTVPPLVHRKPGAAAAPTRPPAGFWCPRTAVAAPQLAAVFAEKESGTLQCLADLVRCETRLYNALNAVFAGGTASSPHSSSSCASCTTTPGPGWRTSPPNSSSGSIGATGKGIDGLEQQAWVRRRFDPSDRRSSLPDLTDDGRQPVETAEATFTETLAELTADTLGGPSGLAAAQILSELRSACERDRIGLPTG